MQFNVHWIFYLLYAFIVVVTIITVLLDNRQPAKTMAWVLVLSFVPIVGFVLYFFFGQNTRKMRIISSRSLDQLTKSSLLNFVEQPPIDIPDRHKEIVRLFAKQGFSMPFKDNEVDILTDGYAYFGALLRSIGRAQHHIHIEVYIFSDDALGRLISDALIDKARQGVEVRIICDSVGCWHVKNSFFQRLRQAGVEVHEFLPVRFPALTSKVNYRNHCKLCIVDGREAFVGGMNIALRYIKGMNQQPWRDTQLHVRGASVYGVQCAFLVDWYFVDRTLVTNRKYYPQPPSHIKNDCLAQLVTSSPIAPWPEIMQGYVRILMAAKHYVYMETPYFLPTEPVLFAMRTAALAGVDVRLMIPRHGDSQLLTWASISYIFEVAEAGVKVYFYKDGFNHSKLLVSDDALCTCGSTNIDFRSFENNFEANIFFYDQPMALRMKQVFVDDMQHCVPLDDVNVIIRRPFLRRLWESVVRLLSPLL